MMSEEPHHHHHHHHHHHFNDFPAANASPMTVVAHDPFAGGTPSGGWAGETSYFRPQSLSLSLCNPPQLSPFPPPSHHPFHIKTSKYLLPAQELLSEFCCLGAGLNSVKRKHLKTHDESSSSMYSMEPMELQKRKANLISMLEEVDRRYKRYCEQMKAVVAAFEEMAGDGAAKTYSSLASKAMSRHFRCLRDGIATQIRATRRAMGESNVSAIPGLSRGETPRLRILDQSLRQHKAFQQAAMVDGHPWRPQRGLPERSVSILRAWLFEHFLHPYPSDIDKHVLARQTGLSRSQVSNWFINARVRLWKPMVEEMYLEEMKDVEKNIQSPHATLVYGESNDSHPNSNINPNPDLNTLSQHVEPKVELTHLHIEEPHSLSSIFSSMNVHNQNVDRDHLQNLSILNAHFGAYRGPELALGRQQHERQHLFARESIGNEHFSMMDGEGQNIPYRNYAGAQLLHDLAG